MKNGILRRRLTHVASSASAVILLGGMLTACQDDLLTGMPEWLGSSIYEELESRGNFTETLELINAQEEDYASVLRRTGSKTLFVADDDAWKEFYKSNPWGITSIKTMTPAQKKLLFKSNMINSAYLCELLGNIPAESSTSDPVEGSCMRRNSSVDISDSIPVITNAQFPPVNPKRVDITDPTDPKQIDWWEEVRGRDSLKIFMDDNVATMIHFMPKFMQFNKITDDDVAFMTNGGITSNKDAFVNGKVVKEKDITCQNGYIHVLEGVGLPMDNMANVIANEPKFSMYSRLLDRFSYPYFDQTLTNRFGNGKDSIYVKRYFNDSENHGLSKTLGTRGFAAKEVSARLPYDPGWNRYYLAGDSKKNANTAFQDDAAAMLVPTDEAMKKYLDTDGKDLKDRYGTPGTDGYDAWDNAPDAVVLPLLQNTMQNSMKSAIPSVFSSIMNTAAETMDVKKEDIDSVLWACNGVIYQTNKVYLAPEYVSVFYPCVIRDNDDLHLVYTTVNNDNTVAGGEGMKAYLNSMGTKYSFVIPTDNALQNYYDPVSYKRTDTKGNSTAAAYAFRVNNQGRIDADAYPVDWTVLDEMGRGTIDRTTLMKGTGLVPVAENKNSKGSVFNRMKDIIYGSMALSLFEPGQKFYQSKAGGPIVVDWDGDKVAGIAGSFQYERGYFVPVTETFDKSKQGNGRSYLIDEEPLMSTSLSPYAAITDSTREEFRAFASLLSGCDFIGTDDNAGHTTMDNCLRNLSNFHYTIYVPTSSSIEQLISDHKLPTSDDRSAVDNAVALIEEQIDLVNDALEDEAGDTIPEQLEKLNSLKDERLYLLQQDTIMKDVMDNFVSYHMQDYSVYVDGAAQAHEVYESQCLDTATTRFAKIYVDYTPGGEMVITDNNNKQHHVDPEINNILTRQYYFNGKSLKGNSCSEIYSSSYAVIHLIDSPMMPFRDGDPAHPDNGYYNPETYDKVMAIVNKYYTPEPNPDSSVNPVKRHKR